MTSRSSQATVAVLEPHASPMVTCLLCHTPTSLTQNAIDTGSDWQCVRCGQRWDATRLAAVAAYGVWVDERKRAGGPVDGKP